MDHWYCAHFTAPWGHNINAIDIMIPCPNPKLSQNWTIDIMTSWVIDIVPMLLSQGVTISMPLILWPHVPIRNLAKNWTIDIMTPWTVDIVTCGRGHKINIDITASLAMILCTCWYYGTLPLVDIVELSPTETRPRELEKHTIYKSRQQQVAHRAFTGFAPKS